ncbi:DUF3105 domain-containing protein [Deinococcus sp. UYEF24]
MLFQAEMSRMPLDGAAPWDRGAFGEGKAGSSPRRAKIRLMWRLSFFVFPLLIGSLLVGCGPKKIEGLKTLSYAGGQQQEGKIAYAENPPLGGAYSPLWQKCGAYTAPLYDEYGVHSLERGAVWITYSPALPAADVATLRTLLAGSGSWLLSPRNGLSAPVVLSAWNAQIQATGAGDERLMAFLEQYAQPIEPAQDGSQDKGQPQANTAPEREKGCATGYNGTQ